MILFLISRRCTFSNADMRSVIKGMESARMSPADEE
jgi:hypothetical protein